MAQEQTAAVCQKTHLSSNRPKRINGSDGIAPNRFAFRARFPSDTAKAV